MREDNSFLVRWHLPAQKNILENRSCCELLAIYALQLRAVARPVKQVCGRHRVTSIHHEVGRFSFSGEHFCCLMAYTSNIMSVVCLPIIVSVLFIPQSKAAQQKKFFIYRFIGIKFANV